MGNIRETFKDSTFYFGSYILIQLCGLISLPVWTRVLSTEEYGLFSLVVITINFLTSGSKFGLQHAALRYYSSFKVGGDEDRLASYYTTIMASSIVMGTLLSTIFVFIFDKLGGGFGKMNLPALVFLIAALGVINSANSIQVTIMRAVQSAKRISVISVIKRYSNFLLPFVLVSLWGFKLFFIGWLVTDFLVLAYLFIVLGKTFKFKLRMFSFTFLKEALSYGIPLIGFELSMTLLAIGDRYLIKWFMGDSAVGIYSAGYNIASYGGEILSAPMRMAALPILLNIWERSGAKETQEFLERIFRYYLLVAIPLIFGMLFLKEEVVAILLSSKFFEAAQIIPYVTPPLIIYGAFFIYGAGFFIQKKSLWLAGITSFAALINVLLNLLLIPSYGLKGSAIATCIAYIVLTIMIFIFSRRLIKVSVPTVALLKYVTISCVMILVLSFIGLHGLVALATKVVLGVITYGMGVLIIDADFRNISLISLQRLRDRMSTAKWMRRFTIYLGGNKKEGGVKVCGHFLWRAVKIFKKD